MFKMNNINIIHIRSY